MSMVGASRSAEGVDPSRAYSLVAIPPQPFDKYTLIGKLGHGGMAEVNLAVADGRGGFRKLVVIKRLHSHLAMEPGFVEMFLDEARLAARLNHPHCVSTHEVGEWHDNHFLAMEYLDGQGLERLLRMSGQKNQPIPVDLCARIVSDALDGLAYAHELTDYDGSPLHVVHRDVSPQNLFVTYNGVVKLLDFGIAKAATHIVETKTGVIKGKYAYIAPEQALGADVDQRSDLWSMGVVLWETLTGRRLFKSVNELATLHETLSGEVKLPSVFRPDLPTELDTICMRALTRDPNERYQSAQEMKDELDRFLLSMPKPPGRKQIARLMRDRFGDVIELHKSTLAACLEGTGAAVSPASIERLVDPGTSSASGIRTHDSAVTPTPTPSYSGVVGTPLAGTAIPAPPSVTPPPRPVEAPSNNLLVKALLIVAVILLAIIAALVLPLGGGDDPDEGAVAVEPRGAAPPEPTGETAPALPLATHEAQHDPEVPLAPPPPEATGAEAETEAPTAPSEATAVAPAEPEETVTTETSDERRRRRLALARQRRHEAAAAYAEPRPEPPPPEPSASPASSDPGRLTLATTPWTQVSVGGRDLGTTPLINVELPAGTHVLRLVNREAGIDETYRVTLEPGQRVSRRLGLR